MAHMKLVVLLLLFLTSINLIMIASYLFSSNNKQIVSNKECPSTVEQQIAKNQIMLKMGIMDIYRIDVSCDYITRDLGEKVSDKYVNYKKKCSISSLNSDIDLKIQNSLAKNENQQEYKLITENKSNFDPFNNSNTEKESIFNDLKPGGVWHPPINPNKQCQLADLDNVVFIVPFSRSRLDNLKLYLLNMHSYLKNLVNPFKYRIVLAEQVDMHSKFNKGRIINSAVKYVIDNFNQQDLIDCIVIHDVDLIPSESSGKLGAMGDYRCRKMPWHLSKKVYNMRTKEERVYNQFLTGGVLSLRLEHFKAVNGFSNEYFGWGAEDDDFQIRMFSTNLCIMRPSVTSYSKAPFTMLPHESSRANGDRFSVLSHALERQAQDGLSNILSLSKVVNVKMFKSFTYLAIQVLI